MAGSSEEIEKRVLMEIRPRAEDREKAERVLSWVLSELGKFVEKEEPQARVRVEGSYAKDTWLRTSPEIDVFILVPEDRGKDYIKQKLFPRLLEWFREHQPRTRYSEHPYLVVNREGIRIEIVPALHQKEPGRPLTAVDRTPLHTEYIRSRARDPEIRDQIRLAKQFAKNVGVYGAEIAVEGFSGYLIELLVLYYGGFRPLLESSTRWKPPVVIDPENHYGGDKRKIIEKFGKPPMIVVDPVDPNRNVAAALSLDKMAEFSIAASLYLKNPSEYFFFLPPIDHLELKRLSSTMEPYSQNVLLVRIHLKSPQAPDNLWGQVKRLSRNVAKTLVTADYKVLRCGQWASEEGDRALIACLLDTPTLPELKHTIGPPFNKPENVAKFVEKHMYTPGAGPWVKNGRLETFVQRKKINCVDEVESVIDQITPKSLREEGRIEIGLLTWLSDELSDDEREWVMKFLWGKPRWLLAYLFTRRGVYAIPREKPPISARE